MAAQGGAEGLAGQTDNAWDLPLGAVVLGVRHMGLSGWQGPECMALENELTAWQQQGDFKSTEIALRCFTLFPMLIYCHLCLQARVCDAWLWAMHDSL